MWLSKQLGARQDAEEAFVESAVQTSADEVSDAENRRLQLVGPGGYAWRPQVGDRLIVLKDQALGSRAECPVALEPGECCLFSPQAYLHLRADGTIALSGRLTVNGRELEEVRI